MWTVKLPLYEANRLDIPNWTTIEEFETQEEAIAFVKYEFGAFTNGTIQMVYEGN